MKLFFALLATIFFAAPAWAVDVQMGYDGNLIFEPADVTISAGETVHFVNNMLLWWVWKELWDVDKQSQQAKDARKKWCQCVTEHGKMISEEVRTNPRYHGIRS